MILKEFMTTLVILGCSVWCRLFGWIIFGFFFGSIITYSWINHSISVSKPCDDGCKKLVKC